MYSADCLLHGIPLLDWHHPAVDQDPKNPITLQSIKKDKTKSEQEL